VRLPLFHKFVQTRHTRLREAVGIEDRTAND
jgi:hypothetical protein